MTQFCERGVDRGDAVGQVGTLFGHEGSIDTFSVGQKYLWGIVVGNLMSEIREHFRVGKGRIEGCIEANVRDWTNLENSVARVVMETVVTGNMG